MDRLSMLFWCDFVIPLHAQTLTNDIGSFSFHIFDFFYSQNSWCAYFPFSNQNKPSYVIDVHQWFWLLDANTLFHTRMNVKTYKSLLENPITGTNIFASIKMYPSCITEITSTTNFFLIYFWNWMYNANASINRRRQIGKKFLYALKVCKFVSFTNYARMKDQSI